jgi:hypothetical protein
MSHKNSHYDSLCVVSVSVETDGKLYNGIGSVDFMEQTAEEAKKKLEQLISG